MLEIKQLRYFIAVAEELHFGKAAERLHIAQPALSIQIRALEEKLGGRLFERTSRNVQLTSAGAHFLHESYLAVRQLEKAELVARSVLGGTMGRLNIGYSGSVAYSGLLGQYIQPFRNHMPDIDIHLIEVDPLSQLESLKNDKLDLGFCTTFGLDVSEELCSEKLVSWPPCIVVPSTHRLATRTEVLMSDLVHENFVVYSNSNRDDGKALRALHNFEPNIVHRTSNLMSVLAIVSSGLGISVVPEVMRSTLNHQGIAYIPLREIGDVTIDISMLYKKKTTNASLCSLLNYIKMTRPNKDV
ncbi:LysR substrate-binding domain-containing protein [Vibrio parahaemolyticus]|nr:LysR substrate-binding domain-containing protein [Vibrio parahaemolyticus]